MLKKVLIANRGEIACRIIRTANIMGIATVAVYSDADAGAVHVLQADEAVRIGPGPATDSYLCIDNVIEAARETGADCVHPGYGFLAENAEFAEACAAAGLTFIGPSAKAMRALGGKAEAKSLAIEAGVPVVPGYQGAEQSPTILQEQADAIAYPVMIKAVSGGGGRGMRLVERAQDFLEALESAKREAAAAFADDRVLIEKFVARPRHIEVQVFGDRHGNVVHLFERDCTLQRRNQKVIEEAPAPGMSDGLRSKMTAAAVSLARSVGYEGAGTVEFLVEGGTLAPDASWYFIEMNTRLQVEHPVTEEITGLDLVEWQFRVAAGEALPLEQDDIAFGGHAIEVRLCAEDAANGFQPSIGTIVDFDVLEDDGLRIESGVQEGSRVSPFYDSMLAKLIRVGVDRETALEDLCDDLETVDVLGVKTNLGFLHALLNDDDVEDANLWTGLIADRLEELVQNQISPGTIAAGVKALLSEQQQGLGEADDAGIEIDPWSVGDAFQLGGRRHIARDVVADGATHQVNINWHPDGSHYLAVDGHDIGRVEEDESTGDVILPNEADEAYVLVQDGIAYVQHRMQHVIVSWPQYDANQVDHGDAADSVRAPITGRVARIFVEKGATVSEGDSVAVVEAMKMEHLLLSSRDGRIASVEVIEGAQVNEGSVIALLEAEEQA